MTASRAAANKVKSLLTPKLKDIGLAEEGEPRLFVGEKAMSKEYASSDIRISGKEATFSTQQMVMVCTDCSKQSHFFVDPLI